MPSSIEDINIQLARYHLNTDILQFALPNQQTFESLLHRISENPPNVLLLISQALINQHCQQSYISQEIINLHTNLPEEVFNDITYCLLRLATNNMMNISNAFSLLHAHQEISFIRIVMDVLLQDGLLAIDNFIQLCAIARSDNKKYYISILHILGQRNMLTDVIYRAIVPVMIRSEKTARGFYFIVQKLHSDNNLTDSNMNFFSKLCSESTILSELFDSYDHIEPHQINTILLMIRSEHLFSGLSVDSLKKIITMTENTPPHISEKILVLTRVKRDNPKVELCLDRLNILEILYQTDNLNLKNVMILRGLDNYLKELLTIIKELHSAQILDTEAFSRLCYLCEDEDGIDQAFTETYERLYHILVILRSQGLLNSSNFIILCEMNQEDTSFVSYDFAILEKLMKIFDQHNILSQQLFENIIAIIPASRNFQQQLLTSVTALQKNKLLHFFDALVENIGNLQNRIALIIRLDTAELLNAQSLENIISLIQEGLADSLINMIEILDRHQILTDDLLNQLINEKQKDDQRWSAYQLEDLHECIEILRDFGLLNRGNVATIIQFPLKQLSSFLAGLAVLAKTDLILQRYLDILFVEKNPQFYSCFVVLEHLKISMNEMQREKIITIENPGRIFTYLHDNNLLTQDNFDQFFSKDDGFDYLCYSLGVLGFLSSIDQEELDHLLNQTANNLDELQSFLHFILTKQLDSLNLIQLLNTNNIATIKNYVMLLFDLSIENGVISDLYNQILRNPESINVVVAATTRICHPNHGFNIRIQDLQQILDAGMDAENRATLLITEREDEGSEAQSEFEAYEYDESNRGEGLHTASRTSWMQTYEDLLNDNLTAEVFFTSSSDRRNYERSGGRAFEHAEHGPEARAQAIGLQMTIMPYLSHVISGKQLIQIIDRLINAVTQIPDPNLKRHCKFAVDRLLRDSETDISSSLTGRQILIGSWLYLEDSRYYITDIAEYNTFWIGVISYIAAEDDEVEAIDTSIELSFDLGVFAGDPDMRNFQGLSPACYARVRNISAAIVAIDMGRRDKQRIIAGIDSPDDVIKKSIPIAGASMIEASIKSIEMLRMVKANLAGDNLANYTTENHEILHHYLEYDYFQPDTDVLLYDLLQLDGPLLESFKQGLRVLSTFKHKIQEYKERFTTEDPDILYDINRQLISNIATLEELLDEIKSIPAETNQAPRIEPPSAKRRRLI